MLFILNSYSSLAQNKQQLDSLSLLLDDAVGVDRCDILFSLATENINVDNNASLQFATQAFNVALSIGDTFRIVKAGRYRGQAYRRVDNLSESITAFRNALKLAERHRDNDEVFKEYKNILNGIAITHLFLADYEKALEYYIKALNILEEEGNKAEASMVLNNIGLVYFKLRDYKTALEYYQKALLYKRDTKNNFDLDRLYINIGLCYNQMSRYSEAKKTFEEAFLNCNSACSDAIIIEGEFGLGVSYFRQESYDTAVLHFNNSYKVAVKVSNRRFMGENLVYKGKIYIAKGENIKAIEVLNEAEELIKLAGYNELLIDVYRQFSIVFNHIQDFQNAAIYQGKYINLKDSIYNEGMIRDIARVQTDYAERQNLKTIAAKEEVIQRQRSLNFAIIVIAVLSTLLIFVLFRSNRVKKKVNAALSEAKAIIEEQNKQLLNSNINLDKELKEKNIDLEKANESLRRVNEELDNFIYKTSHDIRGPLASLKGMCNVALLDVKDPVALGYLRKLDITAEKLNTILTRLVIVNQINNSILASERIDFNAIINDVLLLERKKGLPPDLSISKKVAPDIEFYSDKEFIRIILENLIDNAIKFYNDTGRVNPFVDITVGIQDDNLRVRVVDNGIGISQAHPDKIFQMFSRASERSETGGIGLYITKTAVQKLGGSINLKTTTEGHTEFFVMLPLSPAKVMA